MKEYSEYNDYELLSYVKEGSEESLQILFEKYRPLIHGVAGRFLRYCSSYGLELSDLIQEGMLGFHNAIQTYSEQKDVLFYTYAKMCIERKILTIACHSRRQKHRILNESVSFDLVAEDENTYASDRLMMDNTFNPEKVVLDIEQENQLLDRVRSVLTDFETQVFELKLNDFSYREIADILDRDLKAIDNALQRIRFKFKEQIQSLSEK